MLNAPAQTHRRTRSALIGGGGTITTVGSNGCIPGFGCIMPRAGTLAKVGDFRWRTNKKSKNATIACSSSLGLGFSNNGTENNTNDNNVNKPANQHQFLLFPSTYEPSEVAAAASAAKCQQQPGLLCEQLEQCVRQGQAAISELEVLHARNDVLGEIQADFELHYGEQEEDNGDDGLSVNFVDKFVHQVKSVYDLARRIEMLVPSLLEVLCSGCSDTILTEDDEEAQRHQLLTEQLLSKNFAKLLDMAIRFDTLKAATPALQNGFSMYRRLMQSVGEGGAHQRRPVFYSGDQMALFLSRPAPLLISVVNGAERYIGKQSSRQLAISHLAEALLVIYNVLKYTLERRHQLHLASSQRGWQQENPVGEFLLRAMAGILLLFDHVDQNAGGVFCCTGSANSSPFDIAEFVALVRREHEAAGKQQQPQLTLTTTDNNNNELRTAAVPIHSPPPNHLAILRFMSRHFNDAQTPAHIRRMFD